MLISVYSLCNRDIECDEELSIDYICENHYPFSPEIGFYICECKCGSKDCVGARLRRLALGEPTDEDNNFVSTRIIAEEKDDAADLVILRDSRK